MFIRTDAWIHLFSSFFFPGKVNRNPSDQQLVWHANHLSSVHNLHLEIITWSPCITPMYEHKHDVTSIMNEFANTNSPVKIHSFNDKHTSLDDIPIYVQCPEHTGISIVFATFL